MIAIWTYIGIVIYGEYSSQYHVFLKRMTKNTLTDWAFTFLEIKKNIVKHETVIHLIVWNVSYQT